MNEWLEFGWVDAVDLTTASGAGGNTTCNIRPPAGERWLLAYAIGFHDDAARNAIWYWVGAPAGTVELTRRTALATTAKLAFYSADEDAAKNTFMMPIVATYTQYPQFLVEGMANAKNIYVRYLAYKLRGTGEWGNT
jgi:hypothetical protein